MLRVYVYGSECRKNVPIQGLRGWDNGKSTGKSHDMKWKPGLCQELQAFAQHMGLNHCAYQFVAYSRGIHMPSYR